MDAPEDDNFYHPDDEDAPAASEKPKSPGSISWTASEYIERHHGTGWYAGLVAITVVITVAVYFITKAYFASGVIIVVGIIVGVFVGQKPRQVKYEVTNSGIKIGGKLYAYSSYKSFSILRDGALTSINLFPLKRFVPPLTAYFEPAQEAKITKAVSAHLPYEDRQLDSIDRLARRLRL